MSTKQKIVHLGPTVTIEAGLATAALCGKRLDAPKVHPERSVCAACVNVLIGLYQKERDSRRPSTYRIVSGTIASFPVAS